MCGIFGVVLESRASISKLTLQQLLVNLYNLSESRGKESAGLHLYLPLAGKAWTLKGALPASKLLKSPEYAQLIREGCDPVFSSDGANLTQPVVILAHSRLVTNGTAELAENNQPVRWGAVTMIHNGIVVNVDALWAANQHLKRHAQVDTEVMAAMAADSMTRSCNTIAATQNIFSHIRGAASIAWVHDQAASLTLATNTGDLYFTRLDADAGVVFASERYILDNACKGISLTGSKPDTPVVVEWLPPGQGLHVDLTAKRGAVSFSLNDHLMAGAEDQKLQPKAAMHRDLSARSSQAPVVLATNADESLLRYGEGRVRELKRCTCCVLPETFPFIDFDEKGICNYCRCYKPKYKGVDPDSAKNEFIESLAGYRGANGAHDVLVPFSGGRDSCYGLHLIKQEFGFSPVTFTYDWGMVTDLARRNIARLCGQLGVQNILVSADIKTKRENIRKNVSAWLKQPDLGMVPLFMAGDKHFFTIVNQLKRQTGIKLDLWAANPLENTDFKSGYCGVKPDFEKKRVDYLSLSRKAKMAGYYASRFLKNPRYLNSSIRDTMGAFLAYYLEPRRDFFFMFHHLVWNEDLVNQTLIGTYDFELAPDSPSTWRIGDGTAPFYNYIYMTARGFTEFDTFRSNQIREGMITRERAMEAILVENRPRVASLRWYLDTIGLDFDSTVRRINELDVLGLHR